MGAGGAITMLKLTWANAVPPATRARESSNERAIFACFIGILSKVKKDIFAQWVCLVSASAH